MLLRDMDFAVPPRDARKIPSNNPTRTRNGSITPRTHSFLHFSVIFLPRVLSLRIDPLDFTSLDVIHRIVRSAL